MWPVKKRCSANAQSFSSRTDVGGGPKRTLAEPGSH